MTDSEMLEIQRAEEELRQKLAELSTRKAEIKHKMELEAAAEAERKLLSTPMTVKVVGIQRNFVHCKSDFRPDLLKVWQEIPGRQWRSFDNVNAIPMSEWADARAKLLALPLIEVDFPEKFEEYYKWFNESPKWFVEFSEEYAEFTVTAGPNHIGLSYYSVPGAKVSMGKFNNPILTVPRNEGWRLAKLLEETETRKLGAVWSEAAAHEVATQITERSRLDRIAISRDTDFIKEINGVPLDPHQRVGVEFGATNGCKLLLADDTGTGKTRTAIALAEYTRLKSNPAEPFQTLVIGPARLLLNLRRELETVAKETPYVCLTGKPDVIDLQALIVDRRPYVMISYDTLASSFFTRDGQRVKRKDRRNDDVQIFPWVQVLKTVGFNFLLCDEIHDVRNSGTNREFAFASLVYEIPNRIFLSATPGVNSFGDYYNAIRFLNPSLFTSRGDFLSRYTTNGKDLKNRESFFEMMRPIYLKRRRSDIDVGTPDKPNIIPYTIDLLPAERDHYNEVLKGVYEEISMYKSNLAPGQRLPVQFVLTQMLRLFQVCSASKVPSVVEHAQNLRVEYDMNNEPHKKILIYSRFLGAARKIADELGPEAVCTVRRGDDKFSSLSFEERDALFESVRHDPKVRYIVTTHSAASDGHNLDYCYAVLFNDRWWNDKKHEQCYGRAFWRRSNPHNVDVFYFISNAVVEAMLSEMLDDKTNTLDEAEKGIEESRDFFGSSGAKLAEAFLNSLWSTGK